MAEMVQRINGALMAHFIGSKAVIVAFVESCDPSGVRASCKSTDKIFFQVVFSNELTFPLEQGSLVRLYGTVSSKNRFNCESFAHYSKEIAEKFDINAYEQFVKIYPKYADRIVIDSPIAMES